MSQSLSPWLIAISASTSLVCLLALRLISQRARLRSAHRILQSMEPRPTGDSELPAIDKPWLDRLVDPVLSSPYGEWLKRIANRAGVWEAERVRAWLVRKFEYFFGAILLFVMLSEFSPLPIALLLLLPIAALALPDLILFDRARSRMKRIANALPETIDLIAMCVSAGIGFHAGLQRVATANENPLSEEFSRVLSEMQLGQGRSQALVAMSERLQIPTLRSFVNSVLQVDRLGVPLARVLEDQSLRMRSIRREQAREHAQKLPVKILAPIMLFLLPSILLIVLGPALVTIMRSFN